MAIENFGNTPPPEKKGIKGNIPPPEKKGTICDHMRHLFTTADRSKSGGEGDGGPPHLDQSSEREQSLGSSDHAQEAHKPTDQSAQSNDGYLLPKSPEDLQRYNQKLVGMILNSATEFIKQHLADRPPEDWQKFQLQIASGVQKHLEQQRANQSAETARSLLQFMGPQSRNPADPLLQARLTQIANGQRAENG